MGDEPTKDKKLSLHSTPAATLVLELWRDGHRIKAASYEKDHAAERTLRPYEEREVDWGQVESGSRDLLKLLRRANKRGVSSLDLLESFKRSGQLLFDLLFPPNVRQILNSTSSRNLILNLDEQLVQIPWELLFNGREFLCRCFAMGRIVITRQSLSPSPGRALTHPLRVLILADPRGDLEGSYREGRELRTFLDTRREVFRADFKSQPVDITYVRKNLREYDLVHYAGHAEYDSQNPSGSGWLLSDGKLEVGEIIEMAGLNPMPSLVFANACQSAETGQWKVEEGCEQEIFGLANAYLRSGVQHYVGTFGEIADDPSLDFAGAFYRCLAEGGSVGEAIREAREQLAKAYDETTILWACYVLYGDPTASFVAAEKRVPLEEVASAAHEAPARRVQAKRSTLYALTSAVVAGILAAFYFTLDVDSLFVTPAARKSPKNATSEVATTAVPLSLTMNIIGQRKEPGGGYREVLVGDGSVLHSHDNFQLHIVTNRPAFTHVLLYDSQGRASQLFPRPEIAQSNRIEPGKSVFIPGRDLWFWLDENPGTETLYILASENPMSEIQDLLAQMNSEGSDGKKRIAGEIHEKIAFVQRGVGGITQGQAFTYTLSDGERIEKMTEVVTGSGALVRAVSFEHR